MSKVNTNAPQRRLVDADNSGQAAALNLARSSGPVDRAPLPGMPPARRTSTSAQMQRCPTGNGAAMLRRNSIQTKADWVGTQDNVYDHLGEQVPENTFKGLAAIVATQAAFKESRVARNFAFSMQKTGLMSYKSAARMLRVPPHVAQVIWLAISDPEVRKIAKMGLEISRANPETNGIPPEGFKPLYDLMRKWGFDNKGALVDPEKFEARKQFMTERAAQVSEFRQFGEDIARRMPPVAADPAATHEAEVKQAQDNSLVGFLASFFVSTAKPESTLDPRPRRPE